MTIDLSTALHYLPTILQGFLVTLQICGVALAMGLGFGLLIGLMRTSPSWLLRGVSTAFVDIVRNIPFMVQVFIFFYILPFYEIRLSPVTVGIVSLTIFATSYYGEVFRAAINAVPHGQYESAIAIGFNHSEAMWRIVLPQSIRFLIPPMTNNTISLAKESAILSTITVPEMTYAAQRVIGITFAPFEVYFIVALLYWALSYVITHGGRAIESYVVGQRAAR